MQSFVAAARDMTVAQFRGALKDGRLPVGQMSDGETLLHHAVFDRALGKTRILLAAGADARATNSEQETPLHFAVLLVPREDFRALHATLGCVRMLLDHGADINAQDKHGWAPLHILYMQIGEWRRSGPNTSAAAYGEVERLLREKGADPSAKDRRGRTPEDIAAAIAAQGS